MIIKSFHQSRLAVAVALVMTGDASAQPTLNWNEAETKSDANKTLPAPTQSGLAQSQLGTGGFKVRANELNPQPLPPAQPNPDDRLKPVLEDRIKSSSPPPRVNDKVNAQTSVTKIPKNLFNFEDRAIIIVGGKQSTAGEAKRALLAEIAKKAGPAKTIKGGARTLDLDALNVTKSAIKPAVLPRTMERPAAPGKPKPLISQAGATSTQAAMGSGSALAVPASRVNEVTNSVSALRCLDKAPPLIDEVEKRLKPGTRVIIWGRCLGDRPGRVEIIGQFFGGKLTPAFTSWEMTGVEIEIPANVRGAVDHAVAVSIVTADGKTTPAKQAQFVASRERVAVPERLWSPTAKFELSATGGAASTNAAYSGQLTKTLRVNPQCALYDMDALVLSGGVTQIRGWDASGPPNEASVSIDWVGTCTEKKTISGNDYVVFQGAVSVTFDSACRVAFQTQASAYCPVGIAP